MAAGRPEAFAWENLTGYEKAAWREAAARTIAAFVEAALDKRYARV